MAMKAWIVDEISDDGTMRFADLPQPEPGPGQCLVRVMVAGVNFLDTLMVRGRYQRKPALPFTPGVELVGTVVTGGLLPPGSMVCASIETGAFAEYALVPDDAVRPVPGDVPPAEALVLLGINYPTSYYALHDRGHMQAGETVLVHAGAGGVGSAAVQIAKAAGCRVIATAGSAAKVAACRALGADEALDYSDAGWIDALRALVGRDGIDIVYDPVGGPVAEPSLRAIAWHGRYLVVGFAGGAIPALAANRLLLREASAIGVLWGEARRHDPALSERIGERVLALYRQGAVPPLIGARFPLDQAPAALAQLAGRATSGKVLLAVSA